MKTQAFRKKKAHSEMISIQCEIHILFHIFVVFVNVIYRVGLGLYKRDLSAILYCIDDI